MKIFGLNITRSKKKRLKKGYSGANTGNLFSSWNTTATNADEIIKKDLKAVRERARDLTRNNDYAKKFMRMVRSNIVGANGIILQNKSKDTNGQLDKQANKTIETSWNLWCKKGICDVTGKYSFVDVQKLIISSIARDGEVLVRVVKNFPNKFGFAVQVLEADFLDEQFNDEKRNISMGIEYDDWDKPVAYHIYKKHPSSLNTYTFNDRQRIPADEIIHLFLADRPSQNRGISWFHASLTRLKMLDGYEEATLVNARASAAKMGFLQQEGQDEYVGDDVDSNNNPIVDIEPGTVEIIPKGWSWQTYDPSQPTAKFAEFEKAILRGIASGLDVSYNFLANDLENVNYSSIRTGVLDERDAWRELQNWMIKHFLEPVFEKWLEMALLTQALPLPFSKFDKFNASTWQTRGWAWVDPKKDMESNILANKQGIKTQAEIVSEQGKDLEDVYSQLAKEKELREFYGITTLNDAELIEILGGQDENNE